MQKNSGQAGTGLIRFYLNGRRCEVPCSNPTETVLNYLREELLQTGTKEGCAEGDCGACTIVLAEKYQGRIRFRAINSCIRFLPTLDGKLVYTVEGLRQANQGRLHPVQQAMIDCHGSQCGFCTPGFIMSLFALYKSVARPSRDEIDDALAGNLCRCTGYRPIIAAATKMYEYGRQHDGDEQSFFSEPCLSGQDSIPAGEQALLEQLDDIAPTGTLTLGEGYFAPTSSAELATLYKRYPHATLLAGGTDAGLWVTKQYRDLPIIIYLGQVAELARINTDSHALTIGAGANLADAFAEIVRFYPEAHEITRRFASPPIRNAGTLCGNIANGSPIGDAIPMLLSLGADVVLRCGEVKRVVPLERFYLGYQQKDLGPGEFVAGLHLPLPEAGQFFRAYKISKRFDQDISAVCAAFSLRLGQGRVEQLRIAYGGMAAIPQRAENCEAELTGKAWEETLIGHAINALARDFTPLSDMRASADYRLQVAGNLLKRFYYEVNGADENTTRVLKCAV